MLCSVSNSKYRGHAGHLSNYLLRFNYHCFGHIYAPRRRGSHGCSEDIKVIVISKFLILASANSSFSRRRAKDIQICSSIAKLEEPGVEHENHVKWDFPM
jgi:hypothetical protein